MSGIGLIKNNRQEIEGIAQASKEKAEHLEKAQAEVEPRSVVGQRGTYTWFAESFEYYE